MITRYVNTASTAGGDGTTNGTVGANRAWTSMSEAVAALAFTGYSDDLDVLCSGSAADTTAVAFYASYLANGYTLSFIGNPSTPTGFYGGKLNLGAYRLHTSYHAIFPQTGSAPILVFNGIQIITDATNGLACFYANNTLGSGSAIRNCIMYNEGTGGHGAWSDAACPDLRIENNVIVGYGTGGYGIRRNLGNGDMYAYNNVVVGHGSGLDGSGPAIASKNNVVFNNNDDFSGNVVVDHCASDDGDGTSPIAVTSWADQFYNANYIADCDFRLKSTSVLLNVGVGPAIVDTHTNIAVGKTIECKTIYGGYVATNGNDNNTSTFSHSNVHNYEWSKIDLGALYDVWAINYIKRTSYPDWPSDFSFQTADDWAFTTNVVTLATYSDLDPTKLLSLLTPVNARYFRIQCNSASMPFMVAEFQIFISQVPTEDIVGATRSGNTASVGPFENPVPVIARLRPIPGRAA
jgi:hypothetical protein